MTSVMYPCAKRPMISQPMAAFCKPICHDGEISYTWSSGAVLGGRVGRPYFRLKAGKARKPVTNDLSNDSMTTVRNSNRDQPTALGYCRQQRRKVVSFSMATP